MDFQQVDDCKPEKGNFIAFEGIDGSGKSTQVKMLIERLKNIGIRYYETKEPTDGPIGSLIHQIMTGRINSDDKVIAGLFVADRLDHLLNSTDGICNKIENGITVITDRYYLSSYAYHGVSMPLDWVINANSLSSDILRPSCNIFIDIAPKIAVERVSKGRFHTELYETLERLTKVREKYLETFEKLKDNEKIIIIDGDNSAENISNIIWEKISYLFT